MKINGHHHRPASVRDPVDLEPDIRGKHGRAWLHPTEQVRRMAPEGTLDATVALWVVEAPYAHPIWHSYAIVVVHLRPVLGLRPAIKYLADATHEISVHALNPRAQRARMLRGPINPSEWLQPCNFAAQFAVRTDEDAREAVKRTVMMVCSGRLSPDTDHQRAWVQIYGDNMLADCSSCRPLPTIAKGKLT